MKGLTAAIARNPAPTFQDPQGFAIGVLAVKDLKDRDVELVQWRFRYGPLQREHPFLEHKAVDGQFMTADGETSDGWAPGDHNGCFVAGMNVEGPRALAATLRHYEGVVVDVTLASGKLMTVTPNHPVLTPQGWIAAGLLDEGGYVVGCFDPHGAADLIPDDNQAPAPIEDVVAALNEVPGVFSARVPVSAEHFHGDGEGSEVAVVAAYRLLGDGHNLTLGEVGPHQLLGDVESSRYLPRLSDADPLGLWLRDSTLRLVGSGGLSETFSGSHAGSSDALGNATATQLDPGSDQPAAYGTAGYSETTTQREFRLSRVVSADQVLKVERRDFSGHVYNLQTAVGWYVAEGVIVHNCECWMDPVFRDSSSPADTSDNVDEGGD